MKRGVDRRRAGRSARPRRRLATRLLGLGSLLVVVSLLLVVPLRWFDPPVSAFMLWHLAGQIGDRTGRVELYHRWVPLQAISGPMVLAVVAAEDQRFPHHHGFDLTEIGAAIVGLGRGRRMRGASTLTQQLAKNLFLWPGRDPLRKLLEAWFALLLELTLPKDRILELYLNLAQFGPNTYGVEMASRRVFQRPALRLTARQASMLAAVLPNPRRFRVDRPSPEFQWRTDWIRGQMKNLGQAYLAPMLSATTRAGRR